MSAICLVSVGLSSSRPSCTVLGVRAAKPNLYQVAWFSSQDDPTSTVQRRSGGGQAGSFGEVGYSGGFAS